MSNKEKNQEESVEDKLERLSHKLDLYDREIIRIIIDQNNRFFSVNEVAKELGIAWKTADKHITKLIELDLLTEEDHE